MDEVGEIVLPAGDVSLASWLGKLQRSKDGGFVANTANLLVLFQYVPELRRLVGYDEFRREPRLLAPPPKATDTSPLIPGPYPRAWELEDVAMVQAYLQRIWMPHVARLAVEEAMIATAAMRRYHPVRDWLAGLRWDGTARLGTLMRDAFGAGREDSGTADYVAAVGTKLMVAAVRRVRQPGCKFDHMVVLEGAQGQRKSTSLRVLFGDNWFSDDLSGHIGGKDAAISLMGKWCVELAEIDAIVRAEPETVKAFLSRQVDRYRPPYGRLVVERPRQGVLVGTTNETEWMRDVTGNRRFWPVRCAYADPDWISANREQLWAEAAAREQAGEVLWLDDPDIAEVAMAAQGERMMEDVWTDDVLTIIQGRDRIRISEILVGLGVATERRGRREQMRVGAILRAAGWQRDMRRIEGKPSRVWISPAAQERRAREPEAESFAEDGPADPA